MKTTNIHVNMTFDVEVSQEDIANMLLMRRQMVAASQATAAIVQTIDESIGIGGEPAPAPEPPPPPPAPPPAPPPTPPPAAKKAAPKPAPITKAAAPPAAPAKAAPQIPLEADLRAVLKQVNAIHPKSTAGVVDLLREHGGFPRLTECPPDTWPAIEAAALAYLEEHASSVVEE
jgi:outer membrane biosynthesis protein TonB